MDLAPWGDFPAGFFTDDTQMSVATAEGLLDAARAGQPPNVDTVRAAVLRRYLEWLRALEDPNLRRAPGTTCVTALRSGHAGSVAHQLNFSKGCGGVMRVAPVGLAFAGDKAFEIGAECAALTHGHPSGYLAAGFLAALVSQTVRGGGLEASVAAARMTLQRWDHHRETLNAVDQAVELAASARPPAQVVAQIGGGWVGEEAIAIALYCGLKFRDDWRAAVIAAVNHSGDSDSTGSICGGIVGSLGGMQAIPERWVERVEARGRLEELSRQLYDTFGEVERP